MCHPEDLRKIGFNDEVECNGETLHVQTEVMGRNEFTIRTIIVDGGTVRHSDSQPCDSGSGDLESVKAAAQAQHRRNVDKVREGGID